MNAVQNKGQLGFSFSLPGLLLRLEGLTVFIGAIVLYAHLGFSGWTFAALLLVPDLGMIGYLVSPRLGSYTYNAVHAYTLPLLLAGFGLAAVVPVALGLALIWLAHIGMDRTVGYGLKYATNFKETHLARV